MSTQENTVAERAYQYVQDADDWVRAGDVAEAIDSGTDYTRTQLNDLHEDGEIAKREHGAIIGTSINGEIYVLNNQEQAKWVVRTFGNLSEGEIEEMTLSDLRAYVKENIGDRTGPIQYKVWYRK